MGTHTPTSVHCWMKVNLSPKIMAVKQQTCAVNLPNPVLICKSIQVLHAGFRDLSMGVNHNSRNLYTTYVSCTRAPTLTAPASLPYVHKHTHPKTHRPSITTLQKHTCPDAHCPCITPIRAQAHAPQNSPPQHHTPMCTSTCTPKLTAPSLHPYVHKHTHPKLTDPASHPCAQAPWAV